MTPDLRRVQLHNVANELLLDLSGEHFSQLIRQHLPQQKHPKTFEV